MLVPQTAVTRVNPSEILLSPEAARHVRPANYLLVKLASRCNMNCTYCYWFTDHTVNLRPAVMTEAVEAALLEKLARHVSEFALRDFYLLFHGGEPTLFGKKRFDALAAKLRRLETAADFRLRLAITSNGLLIDEEWIRLFKEHRVSVTLSLDGPAHINDRRRIRLGGGGTHKRVVTALESLRANDVEPGVLAVCDPLSDPRRVAEYFVKELGIREFDILVPDATHDDPPASIAPFYISLFDYWLEELAPIGVRIRYLESIIAGLSGYESHSESIGYGPNLHFTLLTDGSLEALDTVRIVGDGATASSLNILDHTIQDTVMDPLWRELLEASVHLAPQCEACAYRFACGGGHIASRWSKQGRFDNPSAYCQDLMAIFGHIWRRISGDLYLQGSVTGGTLLAEKEGLGEREAVR